MSAPFLGSGLFAEDVGDVRAGAFELLAAQLRAGRAAEQHRREVIDRPAGTTSR